MQSENTAGAETIQSADSGDGLTALRELLTQDDQPTPEPETGPAPTEPSASEEGGSPDDAELVKFNDLAGRLGVELDDLYKLEVSQAEDGTPVTVEALKDAYAKQESLSLRELEFQERRTKAEAHHP